MSIKYKDSRIFSQYFEPNNRLLIVRLKSTRLKLITPYKFVIHCLEKCLSRKRFVEKVKCCQTDGTDLTYFLMINNKERIDEGTRVLDNYLQSRSVIRSTYLTGNCHRFRDKLIKTSDKYVCFVTFPPDRCTTILDKKHEASYLGLFILQFFFSILLLSFALLELGTRCSVVQIILKGCSPGSLCFK